MIFEFGEFRVDFDSRQLVRGSEERRLSGKAWQLLQVLIVNRPRAVSKKEIHDAVWPATFVSESNLASLIHEVRTAFGESGSDARCIRTVHGVGYRFAAEPREVANPRAAPVGRLVWEKGHEPLYPGRNIIGRDVSAAVCIPDTRISRHHAAIVIDEDGATLEDLQSKNGTFLDGHRIDSPLALADGSNIELGGVRAVFRASSNSATATASPTRKKD